MRIAEYTIPEMKTLLDSLGGMYDLARVVDPKECRVLTLGSEGTLRMGDCCYGVWDSDQRCVNCSSAAACRTGCSREKQEQFQDHIFHIQSNPVKLRLTDGGVYEAVVELVSIRRDPDKLPERVNDRAAEDADDHAIRYMAQHDSLTGLLNAEAFYELARVYIREKEELPRVMITGNITAFRMVNDLFGVAKGNEVLMRTAELLRELADRAEGLCGRLSADQFALLLPREKYHEEDLRAMARDLAGAINSGIYTLSIHFGVYEIGDQSLPVSVMCDRANIAQRTIREDMRETVAYFTDALMRKHLFEQEVISGFDRALREEQFQMYLQPLTRADGKPFGAEALVRWVKPDGTILLPGEFISILERAGLIQELDAYIWEQAVRQLKKWQDEGHGDMTISVNMSARDFYNIDVYRVLKDLVTKYGVEAVRLRLEITETALARDADQCSAAIAQLRQAGFIIEIDDFGNGQSSLSMLKDIQADLLKIDMGFLRETDNKNRSRIILGAIIRLADSLGMDVVTEGVETKAQLQFLFSQGCQSFQGYYFSRPIPVEEFEQRYLR